MYQQTYVDLCMRVRSSVCMLAFKSHTDDLCSNTCTTFTHIHSYIRKHLLAQNTLIYAYILTYSV